MNESLFYALKVLNVRHLMNVRFCSVRSAVAVLALYPLITGPLRAAQSSDSSVSPALAAETERAIVRSQEDQTKALALMKEAQTQRSEKNLEAAYQIADKALQIAPSGGPARSSIVSDYAGITLAYAQQLIQGGRYLEAETVLKSLLDPSVNPGNREAVVLLSHLEQPEYYNKTVTPKSAAQRDQVVKLLREAQGLEQSGRHELALKQYDAVLRIDPYNTAARKGMEAIDNAKLQYANEAYNETRSRMLWQVEKAWERPPRKAKQGRSTESVGRQQDARGTDQIVAKLNTIIIPKVDLNDVPVSEAVEYLKQKSIDQDPSRKGVNIFLKLSGPAPAAPGAPSVVTAEPRVTLSLTQVPLYVALDYLGKLSNLKLKIDPYAVSIVPLSEPTDVLITKEYQVPPTFIPAKQIDTNATSLPQAGLGNPEAVGDNPRVAARYNAQEYLTSQGVAFPAGASANYLPAGSKLVVRNTRDNIDQIDALVDAAMGVAPSQVEIQTKFLEINQNNIQELGFDWLLGPFSIGGGMYGSGGGNPNSYGSGVYPFASGGTAIGQYPVGSMRSGSEAVTQSSIDGLLAAGNADAFQLAQGSGRTMGAPAPGIFSIAGIFSDPQFQLVIRALNQKKGIDLMAAPKVTTKSGVKAVVKIIQEFIYPRQYDPPQIPQQMTNNGVPPTITPSFPRDWTKAEIGVILEAKPTIGPDGYTMNLELHPKVTDFDGFINYGSDIYEVGYPTGFSGTGIESSLRQEPVAQLATTNPIKQPVFSYREVNTFVTVWDGQTVALGGLIREDVQKVQDKVPFLGDVPFAGRLFRSESDQKLKKNLIIFVTPRILDANGEPKRGDTDEQEIVTPLGLPQDLPQPSLSTKAVRTK